MIYGIAKMSYIPVTCWMCMHDSPGPLIINSCGYQHPLITILIILGAYMCKRGNYSTSFVSVTTLHVALLHCSFTDPKFL